MKRFLFLIFTVMVWQLQAQELYQLRVVSAEHDSLFFKKHFSLRTSFPDSIQPTREVDYLYRKLRDKGYANASIDSVSKGGHILTAYVYTGSRYDYLTIYNGNIPDKFLSDIGLKNLSEGRQVPAEGVAAFKAKVIQSCENIGYPFAEVRLDSFTVRDGAVSTRLYLTRHELIRYDTLIIQGKTKLKPVFLKNYLGIRSGKVYNESNIRRIGQRLNELQFAEVAQQHSVEFRNEKARVNVFLKDKKASQFDLLIGVLPGSSGRSVLITGDVKLHLYSLFGVGEELFIQWQSLQPKTQTLNVKVVYPYLVGLPLGINVNFDMYKKDTAYIDLNGDYGIQYQLLGSNYIKASLRQKISIITEPDTNYIRVNRALPPNLDLTTNEFALEVFLQRLNYRFNPVSGYVFQASLAAGARTIKKNTAILALYDDVEGKSFGYLYDTVRLTTFQMHLSLMIDKYWKINRRQTVRTMFEGKYFFADKVLENEKYRIGGVASLRGFDDRSIFTPYYLMADLEYRFLLSKNSYFYTFFNAAMVQETRHFQNKPFDFPYGFGVGAAFETKIGMFGLSYALGSQLDNPISFKNSKIHFGYVNYF